MAVPASTLNYNDFTYRDKFLNLSEEEFTEARDIVMAMWSGVMEMWGACSEDVRQRKRSAVMNLLVAWYLADVYPLKLTGGIQSSGGMPVASKHIRDVSVSFHQLDLPEEYGALASNQFGIKAAYLIRYAPDMMGVYG